MDTIYDTRPDIGLRLDSSELGTCGFFHNYLEGKLLVCARAIMEGVTVFNKKSSVIFMLFSVLFATTSPTTTTHTTFFLMILKTQQPNEDRIMLEIF